MTAIAHRYIAIEGPIGVGKTSLTRKLAETLGAQLVLEQAEENPFLERFYRNPRVGALPAQLYFCSSARSSRLRSRRPTFSARACIRLPAGQGRSVRADDAG